MENIGVGLMLMVVGMATVFVILLIVIYLSKYRHSCISPWQYNHVIQRLWTL